MDGDAAPNETPASGPLSATTLIELFVSRVEQSRATEAVLYRRSERVTTVSWQELASDVGRAAAALVNLGLRPGDRVAQVSENRYEWLVLDLAIQMARAIHVPLHASLSGPQLAVQIAHCDARLVAVSTREQLDKLTPLLDQLPGGVKWLLYEAPKKKKTGLDVRHWPEFISTATDTEAKRAQEAAQRTVTPDELATILYTSGTTGDPKGVMLTHANLVSNTLSVLALNNHRDDDLRLSILPWSHILARTCDLYTWMASGCRLAIAESRQTILDDCAEFQPTLLNAVPYFYEKLQRGLVEQRADQIAGSLQRLLGGRIRMCGCGGAALPRYAAELFQRHEIPLLQGYGLTETSPVISLCTLSANRIGTVGRALTGVEIRIADDGEVLTRGPHVMRGYYKNQQATDAVMKDGWFHTGDLGTLDEDGYLAITGRKREMIVLSTGRNVSPVNVELCLTSLPLVVQAIVIGDNRPHLTALIVPNPDVLRPEIKRQRIRVFSRKGALKHPRVLALYRAAIDECLKEMAHFEQVVDFRLLDRGFTQEHQEMTPTLKLRRDVIQGHYSDLIASMYAE